MSNTKLLKIDKCIECKHRRIISSPPYHMCFHSANLIPRMLPEANLRIPDWCPLCDWDNPLWDATDYAHPAWWRAHDYTMQQVCQIIRDAMSGKYAWRKPCFSSEELNDIVSRLNIEAERQ